jgi:hypothetical protein
MAQSQVASSTSLTELLKLRTVVQRVVLFQAARRYLLLFGMQCLLNVMLCYRHVECCHSSSKLQGRLPEGIRSVISRFLTPKIRDLRQRHRQLNHRDFWSSRIARQFMERRCRIDCHLEEKPWTLYPDSGICCADLKQGTNVYEYVKMKWLIDMRRWRQQSAKVFRSYLHLIAPSIVKTRQAPTGCRPASRYAGRQVTIETPVSEWR